LERKLINSREGEKIAAPLKKKKRKKKRKKEKKKGKERR